MGAKGGAIYRELNDKANLHTLGKFSETVSLANLVGKKCLLPTLVLLKTHPHLVGGRILRGPHASPPPDCGDPCAFWQQNMQRWKDFTGGKVPNQLVLSPSKRRLSWVGLTYSGEGCEGGQAPPEGQRLSRMLALTVRGNPPGERLRGALRGRGQGGAGGRQPKRKPQSQSSQT